MRGVAAILAATGLWIAVTRRVPGVTVPSVTFPRGWVLSASVGTGVVTFIGTVGLFAVPAAGAALGVLAAAVPVAVWSGRTRRERNQLADAWPDFLARLRGSIAAGKPLPEAFVNAGGECPAPLLDAMAAVSDSTVYGEGFIAALDGLRHDLGDPMADRILMTITAAHRSGGHRVGAVLAALSTSVADELRLRKAHHAALTEQRLTAAVALAAPWGLLALTIATNPQAAATYRTGAGAAIVGGGLLATVIGYLAARRIARLSKPPRVFR